MRVTRTAIYVFYMSVFTGLIIAGYVALLDLEHASISLRLVLSLLSLFDLFIVEFCVLLVCGVILVERHGAIRLLLYCLSAAYIFIYCLQLASFYHGREFLSRLAIENIDHIYLFLTFETFVACGIIALLIFLLPVILERKRNKRSGRQAGTVVFPLAIIFTAVFFYQSSFWTPVSIQKWRAQFFEDYALKRTAPIDAFIRTLASVAFDRQINTRILSSLSDFELNELKKFGFHYDPTAKFPLIKDKIYKGPAPFVSMLDGAQHPNIIVLFLEGLSARSMGAYSSRYAGLTPHMDEFSKSSLAVHNYFNHTAATYRGLHGQLCSFYPTYGGIGGWHADISVIPDSGYLSLADLLNERGYETIFLDSHHEAHQSRVDEMMRRLGFNTIHTGDVLAERYLDGSGPLLENAFSDKQYFQGVIGFLKERENSAKANPPFFMSLYNYGTHVFLKPQIDSEQYGNGKNLALNKVHTLDNAFGKFWHYFKKSAFAENTIVILTADHCHYPEKTHVKAYAGEGYQPILVDTIPLLIYDSTRRLPETLDARNSTSLDFTPSLAHYLGIENQANPFMGTSIFDTDSKVYNTLGIASIGPQELYLVDDEKIHRSDLSEQYRIEFKVLEKFINITKQLELSDALWNEVKE